MVLALATSAYSSYSACRQYLEDIARARARGRATTPPTVDKVRPYFNHPGFVLAMVERVHAALEQLDPAALADARLVFTAHSIPPSMAATSDYEIQLRDVAGLVAERLAVDARLGPRVPVPVRAAAGAVARTRHRRPPQARCTRPGSTTVVVVPIGFVSDHMEVQFDLDTQAAEAAASLGITMVRAGTVGTHPLFVRGLVDLLDEHLVGAEPKASAGSAPGAGRAHRAAARHRSGRAGP